MYLSRYGWGDKDRRTGRNVPHEDPQLPHRRVLVISSLTSVFVVLTTTGDSSGRVIDLAVDACGFVWGGAGGGGDGVEGEGRVG